MQTLIYIEDLLNILYRKIANYEVVAQHQDIEPISSFNRTIAAGKLLTRKQGSYILQIIKKYKNCFDIENIDDCISSPIWRNEFRVIDTTKYIYLTTDSNNFTWLNIKFPFSYKEEFNQKFFNGGRDITRWDPESQSRKVKLSEVNLIYFVETATKLGFEIEESVLEAVSYVEELWNDEENLVPYSIIENNTVKLVNASESAESYWKEHRTGIIDRDLLLAKQMGFILRNNQDTSTSAKIASSMSTAFWFTKPEKFYEYIDQIQDWPVLIILDRAPEPVAWTKEFIEKFPFKNFSKDDVRICFRPSNSEKSGKAFNDWLKDQNLNKPVAEGKIFVCQHKPPKWMFENNFKIKVVATNSIYPSMNSVTNSLFSSHPSVFYFDKVKPSSKRNIKIAEL